MTRMLIALAFAALTCSCATAALPTLSPADFAGDWSYAEQCGWQHTAGLELVESNGDVRGRWHDGDGRGVGQAGHVEGRVRGNRLEARFCTLAPEGAVDACPEFGAWTDYFVLKDGSLEWFQRVGSDYERYLTLQRDDVARTDSASTTCPDDMD